MSKILTITKCGECPECGFNMNAETREWDTQFCLVTGNDVNVDSMPDDCPLPTDVGKDYEGEITRLKEELRRHKFQQNSSNQQWHGRYGQ